MVKQPLRSGPPDIDADTLAVRVRRELFSSVPLPSKAADTNAPEASREMRSNPEYQSTADQIVSRQETGPSFSLTPRGFTQWAAGVRRRTIERLLHDTFARIELWQMRAELDELRLRTQALVQQVELLSRQLADARAETRAESDRRLGLLEADLGYQHRRLAKLVDGHSPPAQVVARTEGEGSLDGLQAALDDELLDPSTVVKERLLPVLKRFRQFQPSDPGKPVLDLASGRGDWLELLGQAAIIAYGIEPNKHAVDRCTRLGLDVRHASVLEYLTDLPGGALGAITAFHLVERLSIGELVRLLEEARRTLVPGGVLLLGSPNPQNLVVGACTFYEDPARRRPIPAKLCRFLVERSGLVGIEVLWLDPCAEASRIREESETARHLNELIYGPREYVLIARRL